MNRFGLPYLGDGVGLRAQHYPYLRRTPPPLWGVDWFEIVTEDFIDGRGRAILELITATHPVVMHGVALNIGGTDPLDTSYLHRLAALGERLNPAWISDHLCWTGVDGVNSHDLWPLPLTAESLAHVVDRVRRVQDFLGRPLILENPSSYFEFTSSDIPEPEFLAQLVEAAGCGLLLDVNNVHVSATNHGWDPVAYIHTVPADAVVQVHLAGSTDHRTHRIDTHDRPVPRPVWPLYALVWQRTGGVSTLLEWDANIPSLPELVTELAKAKAVRGAG